jgi:hypothetical protein
MPLTQHLIPHTIALPLQDLPIPTLVQRANSARQHRTLIGRGFPYVRSEHIRPIADQDKEHFNKTGRWNDEEIAVLHQISKDYDVNFRINRGPYADGPGG